MENINKAPVNLFIKMHGALVAKNYEAALNYCNAILSYEQKNETIKTFQGLLTNKLEMMDEETDDCTDTSSISSTLGSDIDTDI